MDYQRQRILLQSTEKFGNRPSVEFCGSVFRRIYPVMANSVRMALKDMSIQAPNLPPPRAAAKVKSNDQ